MLEPSLGDIWNYAAVERAWAFGRGCAMTWYMRLPSLVAGLHEEENALDLIAKMRGVVGIADEIPECSSPR